jgi:hypothetical protein
MTTYALHQTVNVGRAFNLLIDYHRSEKLFQGRPGGLGPFIGIKGSFAAGAFAPAFRAVFIDHARQNDPSLRRPAKAGFEKMN